MATQRAVSETWLMGVVMAGIFALREYLRQAMRRIDARTCGRTARVVGIATFLTAFTSVLLSAQCPDGTPPPCGARVARGAASASPNSVAVLYFENLSRDTTDAYLADGLTEDVTAKLGQVSRLAVTSRAALRRLP